mmetsp:Transcript_9226/g.27799  ORF Transcript_9226/g.27799 Transcript_9226/m.27799 type:complete len:249 (-) Transcript_9226:979-1725(-)
MYFHEKDRDTIRLRQSSTGSGNSYSLLPLVVGNHRINPPPRRDGGPPPQQQRVLVLGQRHVPPLGELPLRQDLEVVLLQSSAPVGVQPLELIVKLVEETLIDLVHRLEHVLDELEERYLPVPVGVHRLEILERHLPPQETGVGLGDLPLDEYVGYPSEGGADHPDRYRYEQHGEPSHLHGFRDEITVSHRRPRDDAPVDRIDPIPILVRPYDEGTQEDHGEDGEEGREELLPRRRRRRGRRGGASAVR